MKVDCNRVLESAETNLKYLKRFIAEGNNQEAIKVADMITRNMEWIRSGMNA